MEPALLATATPPSPSHSHITGEEEAQAAAHPTITTAPETAMPKGEEKGYCCKEGRGEEEEKGGSRIWCPN